MVELTREQAVARLTGAGGDFELETVREDGVPLRIYASAPKSMRAVLEASATLGDREFLIFENERLTYAEHLGRVGRLAHWLRSTGVEKGDRVGLCMRNYPEWSIAFFACQAIGAIAVTLNAWWTGSELVYGLNDAQCRIAILDGERVERLEGHWSEIPRLDVLLTRGEAGAGQAHWDAVMADASLSRTLPAASIEPEDAASIMYTSGTTGFPKGAIHTHRNHVTNLYNTLLGGAAERLVATEAGRVDPDVTPPVPCSLQTFPFFHIGGLTGLYVALASGARLVLMYRWDAGHALELIDKERVSAISAVPTVVRQLLEVAAERGMQLDSLAGLGSGGAVVPPDLIEQIGGQFQKRVAPANGYGATETTSAVISNSGANYFAHPHSVGRAAATVDVRVVNDAGSDASTNEIGEFWIRGPNIAAGYWNRPEATAEAFGDGWYRTGDLGYMDEDGFYYVVDRRKDVVIRGGENVYCAEVEAVLHRHPDIIDVAVIGIPDRMLGEEVAAVVEVRPGASLAEDEVREFASEQLARFKLPTSFFFLDEPMPRTASGKVLKRELKQRFAGV